jgi:hypothetical protein
MLVDRTNPGVRRDGKRCNIAGSLRRDSRHSCRGRIAAPRECIRRCHQKDEKKIAGLCECSSTMNQHVRENEAKLLENGPNKLEGLKGPGGNIPMPRMIAC